MATSRRPAPYRMPANDSVRSDGRNVTMRPIESGQLALKTPLGAKPGVITEERAAQYRRQAVTSTLAVHDRATPAEKREGDEWYPKVHDATAKGARRLGVSVHAAAGMVAAVSPNMDFEKRNIGAFDELDKLAANPVHSALLHASLTNVTAHPTDPTKVRTTRSPEFADVLKKHYPGIAMAPDSNIHKALRIREGEHPDSVLDVRTAPKTNHFARNIEDPSATVHPQTGHPLATIDGRQHDIAANRLFPWTSGRGIGSAMAARAGTTRYEHLAGVVGTASHIISAEEGRTVPPSAVQARTWVTGKRLEREMPGAPRDRGPNRVGQPYV